MAKTNAKEPETDAPAEAKKSKKKLIIIVAVVALLACGGAYMFLGGKSSGVVPPPVPGVVVKLDPVNINLATGHYLKLGMALQATKKAVEPPDGAKALDIAISLFSNKAMSELSTDANRLKYKKLLVEKVDKAYEEEVMDVYFTEFVMQ